MAGAKSDKKSSEGKADAKNQSGFQPSPRALGAAVLLMLALGVIVGSATNHFARNAGASTILLESGPPPESAEPASEPTGAEPETEAEGGEAANPIATPSAVPFEAPVAEEPAAGEPEPARRSDRR